MLKSEQMNLTDNEMAWLPNMGKTGRLAMSWACYLNKWGALKNQVQHF